MAKNVLSSLSGQISSPSSQTEKEQQKFVDLCSAHTNFHLNEDDQREYNT